MRLGLKSPASCILCSLRPISDFGRLGFTFYSCPIDVFYHFVRLSRTESDRETLNFKGYEKFIFLFLS